VDQKIDEKVGEISLVKKETVQKGEPVRIGRQYVEFSIDSAKVQKGSKTEVKQTIECRTSIDRLPEPAAMESYR
jgi:hypothetical protein